MKREKVGKKTEEQYKEMIALYAEGLKKLNTRVRVQDRELAILRRRTSRAEHILMRIKKRLAGFDDAYWTNTRIKEKMKRLYKEIIDLEKDLCMKEKDQEKH